MKLREKAAKGVLWSVLQKWGNFAIASTTFIVLSRLLTPEAFGLVAMASLFTVFIEIFLDQGFSAAIVQRAELDPEHLDTAFWMSILMGGILTLIGIAAAGPVASFFAEPRLVPILRVLSIGFLISALGGTQAAILTRNLAFKSLAARSLIAAFIGGVVGMSMAFAGFGVWSLIAQDLVDALAAAVVLWFASDWRPGFRVTRRHYKDLFSFGVSIIGNNILDVLMRRSDDFLIGKFLGSTLLGYYNIGYRLLREIIRLVTGITNSVAFPAFSRIQHSQKRMRQAFYKVTQYTSLLAFPVFIGAAILAPEVIPVVFGNKWLPSVPVMQVLAFIGILQSVMYFNGSLIKAAGKPDWQLGIMALTSLCSVAGFILTVHLGIVAVAASFVLVGYVLSPVSFFVVRKLIHIDFQSYTRQFLLPLAAALIMAATIIGLKYIIKPQGLNLYLELSIYLSAGGLVYLMTILLAGRAISRQVFDLVKLVLPKMKFKKITDSSAEKI